jgi:hypothetical protein
VVFEGGDWIAVSKNELQIVCLFSNFWHSKQKDNSFPSSRYIKFLRRPVRKEIAVIIINYKTTNFKSARFILILLDKNRFQNRHFLSSVYNSHF